MQPPKRRRQRWFKNKIFSFTCNKMAKAKKRIQHTRVSYTALSRESLASISTACVSKGDILFARLKPAKRSYSFSHILWPKNEIIFFFSCCLHKKSHFIGLRFSTLLMFAVFSHCSHHCRRYSAKYFFSNLLKSMYNFGKFLYTEC